MTWLIVLAVFISGGLTSMAVVLLIRRLRGL